MRKTCVRSKYDMPYTVVAIVKAVCADYERRGKVIRQGAASDDVRDSYARLNEAVDDALLLVEEGIRDEMLRDIIWGRGYDSSTASPYISKNAFYRRKRQIVHHIAVVLALI